MAIPAASLSERRHEIKLQHEQDVCSRMRHDHDPEVAAAQQLRRLARTNAEMRRLLGETLFEHDEPRIDSEISDSPDFYLSGDEQVQAAMEDILALIEAELGE